MAILMGSAGSQLGAQDFHEISYATADGGIVYGNLYGDGEHAVLLAHGAVFDKESWEDLAQVLSARGLEVLAIDFRGYGKSRAGSAGNALQEDVLAGIRYLKEAGAARVSVIGGSMGGGAAGEAAIAADSGEIDKLILLAAVPVSTPERLQGEKLFIVAEGDSFRDTVQDQFDRAAEPKELRVLDGSAHAQHIFRSREQGEALTQIIVAWLERGS